MSQPYVYRYVYVYSWYVYQLYVYIPYIPHPAPRVITEHQDELPALHSCFPRALCFTHGDTYILICPHYSLKLSHPPLPLLGEAHSSYHSQGGIMTYMGPQALAFMGPFVHKKY